MVRDRHMHDESNPENTRALTLEAFAKCWQARMHVEAKPEPRLAAARTVTERPRRVQSSVTAGNAVVANDVFIELLPQTIDWLF